MKNIRFVLAPDSFKESMTAKQVCQAMEAGLKILFPEAEFIHVPMADGGEGTMQSLIDATGGEIYSKTVSGPVGQNVAAQFGIIHSQQTAVIEMASASGIQYTNQHTKNPLEATTYGTGELIKASLDKGVKKIILGIGGSATNDGGAGMAAALGVRFLDKHGAALPPGGGALGLLSTIDISGMDSRIADVEFIVACDVTNPLCGETGASNVFGPQKGATPEMIATLDAGLAHYAQIIFEQLGRVVKDVPGAGAAGGLGAGLMAFTQCNMARGIDIVTEYSGLSDKLRGADYCLTGEGGIDFQTKFGKTPYGVAQVARSHGVPVIALAGYIGAGVNELYSEGIDAIFGIVPGAASIETLLAQGPENIARTCENIGRLLKLSPAGWTK
ncbi:glycerate kinase [Rouxiella sp. Mn2063]|uniref:glycerate kinase family protein n=1 Tax=Rouxiella sp. Mn2063 TaxID=3395262 RepID=UPI003BD0B9ED